MTQRNADDVVVLDAELERRLVEWSRWARQRHWLSACRSIESRYRPPAAEVWAQEPRPLPVSAKDAWVVECAWRTGLPMLERMLLRAAFITGPRGSVAAWESHKRRTLRELGLHRHEWAPTVRRSAEMLGNRLHIVETRANLARDSMQAPPLGQERVASAA